MEQERKMKPFKTVKTEYYEEFDENFNSGRGALDPLWAGHDHEPGRWKRGSGRCIRVVTTTEQWTGSSKDPVIATSFEYLQKEQKMNIGDKVMYADDEGTEQSGILSAIGSDKDSYSDLKLRDGVFLYKSKKLKKYVPVKPKSLDSIYIEVTRFGNKIDYILPNELIGFF